MSGRLQRGGVGVGGVGGGVGGRQQQRRSKLKRRRTAAAATAPAPAPAPAQRANRDRDTAQHAPATVTGITTEPTRTTKTNKAASDTRTSTAAPSTSKVEAKSTASEATLRDRSNVDVEVVNRVATDGGSGGKTPAASGEGAPPPPTPGVARPVADEPTDEASSSSEHRRGLSSAIPTEWVSSDEGRSGVVATAEAAEVEVEVEGAGGRRADAGPGRGRRAMEGGDNDVRPGMPPPPGSGLLVRTTISRGKRRHEGATSDEEGVFRVGSSGAGARSGTNRTAAADDDGGDEVAPPSGEAMPPSIGPSGNDATDPTLLADLSELDGRLPRPSDVLGIPRDLGFDVRAFVRRIDEVAASLARRNNTTNDHRGKSDDSSSDIALHHPTDVVRFDLLPPPYSSHDDDDDIDGQQHGEDDGGPSYEERCVHHPIMGAIHLPLPRPPTTTAAGVDGDLHAHDFETRNGPCCHRLNERERMLQRSNRHQGRRRGRRRDNLSSSKIRGIEGYFRGDGMTVSIDHLAFPSVVRPKDTDNDADADAKDSSGEGRRQLRQRTGAEAEAEAEARARATERYVAVAVVDGSPSEYRSHDGDGGGRDGGGSAVGDDTAARPRPSDRDGVVGRGWEAGGGRGGTTEEGDWDDREDVRKDARSNDEVKKKRGRKGSSDDTPEVIGSVKIVSDRGATIRDHYDIDNSELRLGRLELGDVRDLVEKRWLPPDDDDDDSSSSSSEDDESGKCVGVMRYRIRLLAGDGGNELDADNDGDGDGRGTRVRRHEFGWISDRGRLAGDAYRIARVVSRVKKKEKTDGAGT